MAESEFIMDKKIGSGSFGDVFIGCNKKTGEKIAIKRLKKAVLYKYGNYLINAFWKEIDSMKICECENSVRLIKNFETKNNFNIIMELCDTDLLCILNKRLNPFSTEEVRYIFTQLNNVFKIMHKNNIIHRDLKLGNILVKFTDESKQKFIPKLSDYGFSKDLNNQNCTDTHLGTPATMAPEIMMNLQYDDRSDLWSIGAMMYQLHFKEIPYQGFNEDEILRKIKLNYPRKQPNDPQLKDLISKLLVVDPSKRITWDQYFNHPFFKGDNNNSQNIEVRYVKISDFNLGFNVNKDLFQCYIAKDTKLKDRKVLIKSYKGEFITNNNLLFQEEYGLFRAFNGNDNVLKLLSIYRENDRTNLVFEYNNCEMLYNYAQKNEFSEKQIKKFNKTLYENIFVFNECNFLPFIFISIHSFCIDEQGNPIIFDFGFHKLFLKYEEISSYYFPNKSEINIYNKNRIKTNVMNYGNVLLKLFCGDNYSIKDKEIVLPPNKILSEKFNNFLSKCLYRNNEKRNTWLQLGENEFILDNNCEMSNILSNNYLINKDKLETIFDSLNTKFDLIIDYYGKLDIENNMEYLQQIESFIVVTLFEMKIIFNFFNRNIYTKPFNNQHEISFISINDNSEINKCNLNLVNPLLKDTKIIDMSNEKLLNNFLIKIKNNIKNLEKISSNIHTHCQKSIIRGSFKEFLINLLENFENSKIQEYFFSVMKKSENEKDPSDSYKELCLGEYLCEFILFVKTILYDNEEEIHFNKNDLIKKFYDIFGEENKIEISVINLKKAKKNYVLVSFLAILFKYYKNTDIINKEKLEKNKIAINGLARFYPSLMNKIIELKNKINK